MEISCSRRRRFRGWVSVRGDFIMVEEFRVEDDVVVVVMVVRVIVIGMVGEGKESVLRRF